MQLDKVYEPQRFEPSWAQRWIDSKIYEAKPGKPGEPYFSLVIPPPNVTGSLHIGHMLEHTLIDTAVRWHRMLGENTLWVPGTDHAGIATQILVERELAKSNITRHDLGREKFVEKVWEWKELYHGRIVAQMRRLGSSCDWSRERFTMDEGLSRAVRECFVRLYEKGLIYQGAYMVNWCPRCQTALSDLESIHEPMPGNLWHIKYPVIGKPGRFLTVATTRPETMLGDAAVAINPNDERYFDLHGGQVMLPLMNRPIPIILDEIADPQFGTGVVKVTPAHDPNDFAAGKRHGLAMIRVIDEAAKITEFGGAYEGLDRYVARKKVVEDLGDLVEKIEPYTLNASTCQRCKTVTEPLVSKQWWVKIQPLADKAIAAVETGKIQFVPPAWNATYFQWMYNIRDWCISRQLWWGHRIPAWHCAECKGITVERTDPTVCKHCNSTHIEQDRDVLDTWFSSGLFPFSTLGWPDDTVDLRAFYPTTLMITGFDILFFWVARMIMFGLELTGEVPFRYVHIHGLVRDAERQKMSKTKGNVVDPILINDKYGTDAVRLSLVLGAASGRDISFTEDRIEAARNFANKLWNATRFIFMNMERSNVPVTIPAESAAPRFEDRWIQSRLHATIDSMNTSLEHHRYHEAAQTIWHFFWDDFCDWYLEIKKLRFEENSGLTDDWRSLLTTFETGLRLLHPIMPFITEEISNRFDETTSISLKKYPDTSFAIPNPEADREMDLLKEIVGAARNLRQERKLDQKSILPASLKTEIPLDRAVIEVLAKIQLADGVKGVSRPGANFDLIVALPEETPEALAAQKTKLIKEAEQLEKVIANSKRQLGNEAFVAKAPEKILTEMREKLAGYEAQLEKVRRELAG